MPPDPRRASILSLFCGAGGLDLGFQYAGYTPSLGLDHNPAAIQSHAANIGGRSRVTDLASVDLDQLDRTARRASIRGVVGGPPCQGFSNGNVLRQTNDPRNQLVFVFADVVERLNRGNRLDFFLLENVTGLLSARQHIRYETLLTRLFRAGFRVTTHQVDAADFGVPQRRRRVFLIGLNGKRFRNMEVKIQPSKRPERTVRDAIGALPEAMLYRRDLSPSDIPYHPNHWTMRPRSARFADARFNKWRSFRKLEWDELSPTVAYGNREIHVHPNGTRRLSVLEAMLLQGLPKRCVLKGNFSEQVTQVSNLVPPSMARGAAAAIARATGVK